MREGTGSHGAAFPELAPEEAGQIIERFNAMNGPLFGGHLGFRLVAVRRGYARLVAECRSELANPGGIMHGGASFGMADSAVAAALITIYGTGSALLTIEMKINYLEAIVSGTVTAEAWVLRSSRRSAYAEVDVWAGGKLAARASTTYMIRPLVPAA